MEAEVMLCHIPGRVNKRASLTPPVLIPLKLRTTRQRASRVSIDDPGQKMLWRTESGGRAKPGSVSNEQKRCRISRLEAGKVKSQVRISIKHRQEELGQMEHRGITGQRVA